MVGKTLSAGVSCLAILRDMGDALVCLATNQKTAAIRAVVQAVPGEAFENLYLVGLLSSASIMAVFPAAGVADAHAQHAHPASLVDGSYQPGRVIDGRLAARSTRESVKHLFPNNFSLTR